MKKRNKEYTSKERNQETSKGKYGWCKKKENSYDKVNTMKRKRKKKIRVFL